MSHLPHAPGLRQHYRPSRFRAVSVWPPHLEPRRGAPDDGAHQFEQVGTYATQIPEARARL